jgi:hypothetical protein
VPSCYGGDALDQFFFAGADGVEVAWKEGQSRAAGCGFAFSGTGSSGFLAFRR